jgi:hypothetical protein
VQPKKPAAGPISPELAGLLEFTTPRAKLNRLVTEGDNIGKAIPPDGSDPDPLVVTLGLLQYGPEYHFKRVAGWEARAAELVSGSASSFSSLFTTDEVPRAKYAALRAHMNARVAELREILKKL